MYANKQKTLHLSTFAPFDARDATKRPQPHGAFVSHWRWQLVVDDEKVVE